MHALTHIHTQSHAQTHDVRVRICRKSGQSLWCCLLNTTIHLSLQRMQVGTVLQYGNLFTAESGLEMVQFYLKALSSSTSFVHVFISHHYLLSSSSPAFLLKSVFLLFNIFFWTSHSILICIIWRYVLTPLTSQNQDIFHSNDTWGVPSSFHTLVTKRQRGARKKLGNSQMIKWLKGLLYEWR